MWLGQAVRACATALAVAAAAATPTLPPLLSSLPRSVCTAWRAAADQEGLWSLQRQRDFPQADDATLAVLLERAGGGSSTSGGGRQAQRHSAAKLAYWWLARESTCERCQQVRYIGCCRLA